MRITRADANARFQQWQALLGNRAKRQRAGEFLIQGVRPISLAVEFGWPVHALIYDAELAAVELGGADAEGGRRRVIPIPGYGDVETIGYGADNAVVREAVAASPLPPMPLAVLAHGKPFPPAETSRTGSPPGSWKRSIRAENESLAALVPDARFTVASRERPRHPPGSTRAGDRSDPAGGGGRAQPGHLVRPGLLLHGMTDRRLRGIANRGRASSRSDHADFTAPALLAASLLGGAIATLPGSGQAQDATPVASPAAGVKTTAIVVSATNDPLRVSGSDGLDHLEYDLLVTNGFAAPVTLTSISD